MPPVRRPNDAANGGGSPPPEAFDYDDDVTTEAVQVMAARAKAVLEQDEYVLIEGYFGNK